MPHSILLQQRLEEEGFIVHFWYYKDLTPLYPWKILQKKTPYHVFKNNYKDVKKVFAHAAAADFLIITGWHTYIHLLLMVYAKIARKKYALWIDIHTDKISAIKKLRNKIILNAAPFLFVTGKVGFQILEESYGLSVNKMSDFPYLTAEFNPAITAQINKQRMASIKQGGMIRLLISNRFIDRKGYSIILDAVKMLPAQVLESFEITILGTGPGLDLYKKAFLAVKKNIHFTGWVEYKNYLEHLAACDIFLHASLDEPFGIPPMDAMACGKMTIGSSGVISCKDRIFNGVNGFIYKKNNPEELAEILTKTVSNKAEIYSIGNSALQTAKVYTPDYNIAVIKKILENKTA